MAFPDTEFSFIASGLDGAEDSTPTSPWSRIDLPVMCLCTNKDPFDDNLPTGAPRDRKRREVFDQVLAQVQPILQRQHRTFLFMVVFVGSSARLVRFDRSLIFETTLFKLDDSDFLVDFLARHIQLSPEDRGYDTSAQYIEPVARDSGSLSEKMRRCLQDAKTRKEEDHIVTLWEASLDERWPWWKLRVPDELTNQDRWYVVGKPSFKAHGVLGRGTRGYVAVELIDGELDGKFVYLKDTWRTIVTDPLDEAVYLRKEGETLKRINEANVAHVPTLVAHGDIQGQETQVPKDSQKVNDKRKHRVKKHQHYRLVVEEIGKPLSRFKNSGQLVLAMHDCIRGRYPLILDVVFHCLSMMAAHSDACKIAIIHQDISGGNVLLYKGKKGQWRGLLTDWELSKDFRKDSIPRHRACTVRPSVSRFIQLKS